MEQWPFLQIDTTSTSYKIGYHVGSWLPFAFLVLMGLLVMWMIGRRRK
ncbi:MAG: cytochrome c-type biogenesis protein CcmH [Chitinophagaceae bacterium]|jgi:hypothetical protein|nr:cytochrome c-type biogenesis protein CcmH [Chitinophagaceae bacterium]